MNRIHHQEQADPTEDFLHKLLLFKAFQQVKNDLELQSLDCSDTVEENSQNMTDEVFSEITSVQEKIDEDQLFFNQKRERIKKKIEENAAKNNKNKEKLQQKQMQKGNNTNFIKKNSNVVPLKDKSLTKRLNGMSVRISRGQALNTKQK